MSVVHLQITLHMLAARLQDSIPFSAPTLTSTSTTVPSAASLFCPSPNSLLSSATSPRVMSSKVMPGDRSGKSRATAPNDTPLPPEAGGTWEGRPVLLSLWGLVTVKSTF